MGWSLRGQPRGWGRGALQRESAMDELRLEGVAGWGGPQACGPETGGCSPAAPDAPGSQCLPAPVPRPSWGRTALQDLKLLVLCGGKQVGDTEMKRQMTAGWASTNSVPQGGRRGQTPLSALLGSEAELRGRTGGNVGVSQPLWTPAWGGGATPYSEAWFSHQLHGTVTSSISRAPGGGRRQRSGPGSS